MWDSVYVFPQISFFTLLNYFAVSLISYTIFSSIGNATLISYKSKLEFWVRPHQSSLEVSGMYQTPTDLSIQIENDNLSTKNQ